MTLMGSQIDLPVICTIMCCLINAGCFPRGRIYMFLWDFMQEPTASYIVVDMEAAICRPFVFEL